MKMFNALLGLIVTALLIICACHEQMINESQNQIRTLKNQVVALSNESLMLNQERKSLTKEIIRHDSLINDMNAKANLAVEIINESNIIGSNIVNKLDRIFALLEPKSQFPNWYPYGQPIVMTNMQPYFYGFVTNLVISNVFIDLSNPTNRNVYAR